MDYDQYLSIIQKDPRAENVRTAIYTLFKMIEKENADRDYEMSVAFDGTTYFSPATAIKTQIKNIYNELSAIRLRYHMHIFTTQNDLESYIASNEFYDFLFLYVGQKSFSVTDSSGTISIIPKHFYSHECAYEEVKIIDCGEFITEWDGSNYSKTDDSLSQTGVPADAAAVGKISDLVYKMDRIRTIPQGEQKILRGLPLHWWSLIREYYSGIGVQNFGSDFTGGISDIIGNSSVQGFCCDRAINRYFMIVEDKRSITKDTRWPVGNTIIMLDAFLNCEGYARFDTNLQAKVKHILNFKYNQKTNSFWLNIDNTSNEWVELLYYDLVETCNNGTNSHILTTYYTVNIKSIVDAGKKKSAGSIFCIDFDTDNPDKIYCLYGNDFTKALFVGYGDARYSELNSQGRIAFSGVENFTVNRILNSELTLDSSVNLGGGETMTCQAAFVKNGTIIVHCDINSEKTEYFDMYGASTGKKYHAVSSAFYSIDPETGNTLDVRCDPALFWWNEIEGCCWDGSQIIFVDQDPRYFVGIQDGDKRQRIINYNLFELGTVIKPFTDLNSLTTPGVYTSQPNDTSWSLDNRPIFDLYGFKMLVFNDDENVFQIIFSNLNKVYIRAGYTSGTDFHFVWSKWKELTGTDIDKNANYTHDGWKKKS